MNTIKNRLVNLLFCLAILFFIIGFNVNDTPLSGWYQQFMPNLGGRTIQDITFVDSLTGFAVTTRVTGTSYILKTSNRGDNWSVVYSDIDSNIFTSLQFLNANTGYVGGLIRFNFNYHILKTTDGGISWSNINTPQFTYQADISVLNEDTIWFAMDESTTGGVFRTTNGGASWDTQYSQTGANPDKIYMFNARIGFISKSGSTWLRKTTNSGQTWELITGTGTGSFNDMYFSDSLIGWKCKTVGGGGWLMGKTTDGGFNWIEQILPSGGNISSGSGITHFSNINMDTIWASGGVLFFPGQGQRAFLYRTTNEGTTWLLQIPDTSYQIPTLSFIKFTDKLKGWAYMVSPRGIHTLTGGNDTFYTSIKQISSNVLDGFKLEQNYPNPFNLNTNIKYQIAPNVKGQMSKVKITVYDIRGKEITTLVNGKQQDGTYKITFDGTNYPSGIYFYTLFVDGKLVDTKKMILIK